MYATIATVNIKPDKWEEAWRMGEERAKMQIQIPGLKGYIVMSDPEAHRVIKLVLWESKEAMETYGKSEAVKEAMEKSADFMTSMSIENLPVTNMNFVDMPSAIPVF